MAYKVMSQRKERRWRIDIQGTQKTLCSRHKACNFSAMLCKTFSKGYCQIVLYSGSRQIWEYFEITPLSYRYVAEVKEAKLVWMQKYNVSHCETNINGILHSCLLFIFSFIYVCFVWMPLLYHIPSEIVLLFFQKIWTSFPNHLKNVRNVPFQG